MYMYILNFSHPLTNTHITAIEQMIGHPPTAVFNHMLQFDPDQPLAEQVSALLAQVPLFPDEWQTNRLLVNLPGFAPAAAVILSQIHGRTGHFPAIIRLRPVQGTAVPTYELAEIINLQTLRDQARHTRQG